MTQEALDFGRSHRVSVAYRRLLRVVGDAVDSIGLVQAAGACDARKTELNDALQGRDGRYLRVEWLMSIIDIAPPDFRARIYAALGEWQGVVSTPLKPKTPEEKLAEIEQRVAVRFGQAGLELIAEVNK